jgi:hypothetical protein
LFPGLVHALLEQGHILALLPRPLLPHVCIENYNVNITKLS